MKIYTKTGDNGVTSLLGGKRVRKYDQRIHAYGTIDELNAYVGLLRDQINDQKIRHVLLNIQNHLFCIGSLLALDNDNKNIKVPRIQNNDITTLEEEIDTMQEKVPPLKNFILPGGHTTISFCHIARCVCRRAERHVIFLSENETIDDKIIPYLNRLSDFFFVLSRQLSLDLSIKETQWLTEQ